MWDLRVLLTIWVQYVRYKPHLWRAHWIVGWENQLSNEHAILEWSTLRASVEEEWYGGGVKGRAAF